MVWRSVRSLVVLMAVVAAPLAATEEPPTGTTATTTATTPVEAQAATPAATPVPTPVPTPAVTPTAVVEQFHEALRAAFTSGAPYAERYAMLEQPILSTFDIRSIARVSVGAHWRSFDADQRATLLDSLGRLIVTTYASRFGEDAGQRFVTHGATVPRPGRAVVRTSLQLEDRDDVHLDYLLRETDGAPRIYNVSADGVSDLSLRRAEYAVILGDQGFAGLIAMLEKSITDFVADADD